jgi:hypothetical protein
VSDSTPFSVNSLFSTQPKANAMAEQVKITKEATIPKDKSTKTKKEKEMLRIGEHLSSDPYDKPR